jgi:hypothetical protein
VSVTRQYQAPHQPALWETKNWNAIPKMSCISPIDVASGGKIANHNREH